MTECASLDELLEFANAVREAGGGNPLDALMPAVPVDPKTCLIARNLNFNCEVNCAGRWYMHVDNEALAAKIAGKLGLGWDGVTISLPDRIGAVAAAFDEIGDDMLEAIYTPEYFSDDVDDVENVPNRAYLEKLSIEERQKLMTFLPYIESAVDEAREIATIVNPDGSIVV